MNRIKQSSALIFIAVMLIYFEAAAQAPQKTMPECIVLDPGHGGQDTGVRAAGGISEKNILLNLARRLESELLKKGYAVKLTRTRDVSLEIPDRTAVADNWKADVFISLHIGGSFTHQPGPVTVFYFDRQAESIPEHAESDDENRSQILWDDIQYQHQSESRLLAKLMQKRLSGQIKFAEIRIRGAPILIAEGADMPALLIEIGSLHNPVQRKALQSRTGLSDLAKGIAKGVEDFLLQKK